VSFIAYVEKKKLTYTSLVEKQGLELLGVWTRNNNSSYREEVYLDWIQIYIRTEKKY
jgi:hypothetical protein